MNTRKSSSLNFEVVQANAKVERFASKKLNEVLSYQKPASDKSNLGLIRKGSSNVQTTKEMKFVKDKNIASTLGEVEKVVKKPGVVNQKVIVNNPKPNVTRPKAKGRFLPKSKRGPQIEHFYHHCGSQGHTRPNCFKLQALKNADSQRLQRRERSGECEASKCMSW